MPNIPVISAPRVPTVSAPTIAAPQVPQTPQVPQIPAPNVASAIHAPAIPSTARLGSSVGVPTSIPSASNVLNLPKIPAIPGLGEAGINRGAGPQFSSKIMSKFLSFL